MRVPRNYIAQLAGCLALATITFATKSDGPPDGRAVVLFDGRDLKNFDTFLRHHGLHNDPEQVFRVGNAVMHISGKEFAYIITRQEFANDYLRAGFKCGEGTYAPREGRARDSGILYHVQGPQKVWPTSLEFQSIEGGTGDFWMTDGGALTGIDDVRVTDPPRGAFKIDRIGKGPWHSVTGDRDSVGEVEKPHGEWNLLELVAPRDHLKEIVNAKLANEGSTALRSSGKILLQAEGAEVFFRDIRLFPLKH